MARILVVSKNEQTHVQVLRTLKDEHSIASFFEGTTALRQLKSHKEKTYDVIIASTDLGGTNGVAFIKDLRNSLGPYSWNTFPIILLTGHARDDIKLFGTSIEVLEQKFGITYLSRTDCRQMLNELIDRIFAQAA